MQLPFFFRLSRLSHFCFAATFEANSRPKFHLVICILVSVKRRLQTADQSWLVPDLNRENKIQNGQGVNKGKMHRIMISSGPCGKLGSTKWGVQELEVDDIMFD